MDPARPLRILVVDDNTDAADLLGELLKSMGHDVRVVYDGAAAFAQFHAFEPELAILDLGLPEVDGFTLASRLRAQEQFSSVPLIALSGYASPNDRARSAASGFTYHLAKPADFAHLNEIIEAYRSGK